MNSLSNDFQPGGDKDLTDLSFGQRENRSFALPDFNFRKYMFQHGRRKYALYGSKLAGDLAATWSMERGIYCDCHNLLARPRAFRLHYLVNYEGFYGVRQEKAVAGLRDWCQCILAFNSRMREVSGFEEMLDVISRHEIPQAEIAEFSSADPGLIRIFRRLGCFFNERSEQVFDWGQLIDMVKKGALVKEWFAAEKDEGPIIKEVVPDPFLVDISGLKVNELFALFYNNAPSPGMSGAVRAAEGLVDQLIHKKLFEEDSDPGDSGCITLEDAVESEEFTNREMTPGLARKILEQSEEISFDYYKGRRMKFCPNPKRHVFRTESFDECAFPGAGRLLIERLRETGDYGSYLIYAPDGRSARIP